MSLLLQHLAILLLFLPIFQCADENKSVGNFEQNAKSPLEMAPTVPILSSVSVAPVFSTVTEPPLPTAAASVVNVWNGAGWMQLPGLVSVPGWTQAGAMPTAAAALLTFPPLFPVPDNAHVISAAFPPPALLAKREEAQAKEQQEQQQQQQQLQAVHRNKHSVEERTTNGEGNSSNGTDGGGNDNGNGGTRPSWRQFVGIRVRFNPPIFEETARLFYSVFNHEAQHLQIRPQRQCFAEGCFHLHTFRITGFQRPRAITLKPLGPNLLLLNILSFDVDIESLLNGSVQLLLTAVPITGNFQVTARQLSVTALFDLQKDQHRVPYLRIASCELRSSTISTKVTNLGLITDSINLKYKKEMLDKATELIISTVCETISDTIRERVNHVLRRLPRALSVAKILGALSPSSDSDCASSSLVNLHNLALQLDGPHTQRFFSNHLTLSYNHDPLQKQNARWEGRFWRRNQRRRRGMEVIDDETDKGKATVAEIHVEPKNKTTADQQQQQISKQQTQHSQELRKKKELRGGNSDNQTDSVANNNSNNQQTSAECSQQDYGILLDFLDLHSLSHLFVDLDFLDSSAGSDFFAVGISGDVFLSTPHPISLVGGGVHELVQLEFLRAKNGNITTSINMTKTEQDRRKEREEEEEDKSLLMGDNEEMEQGEQRRREFPPNLRFPDQTKPRKSLELIFSDLTANLMLLQAHRAKLLKLRIGPNSAAFGPMLRTTCGPDEVCLSDSIPEAGEKYPDQQLEIEIEPVQPPRVKFTKDLATLQIIAAATFLLAHNGKSIGRIPFSATVELRLRTIRTENKTAGEEVAKNNDSNNNNNNATTANTSAPKRSTGNRLEVSMAIPKLDILEDVDFFELPASTLEGFRDAVRGAILNSVSRALASGIPLEPLERRLCPYGISQPGIQLLDKGLVMLNAELDAYVLLFEGAEGSAGGCSPAEL